jgi:zinc/manganese transport system permease protein
MYALLLAPFVEFDFMRRALAGASVLALSAAPIGVFLMLRRMSLVGDAMAHAILPGAALGYLVVGLSLSAMTLGGLLAGFAVALLAGLIARITRLREDASLAAFYLMSLALGVTLISARGSNIDLLHVLFGSVLALDNEALYLIGGVASITFITLAIILRPFVLESLDPIFLRSVSHAGAPAHLAFLALTVLNLVGGFQALGTLLAVGLMMLPAIASRFWAKTLTGMIMSASLIGIAATYLGLLMSYHLGLASGPTIILVAGLFYILSIVAGPQGGLIYSLFPRKHLEA